MLKNLKKFYSILPYEDKQKFCEEDRELLEGEGPLEALVYKGIPEPVNAFLIKFGDQPIKYVELGRKPVDTRLTGIIGWLSRGIFNEQKRKLNYDQIFHLYLILTLQDGTKLRLEKNQVVSLSYYTPDSPEQIVDAVTHSITQYVKNLREFYDHGIEQLIRQGKEPYLYDLATNNCQIFVDAMLTGNHINNPKLKHFVLQDAQKILNEFPPLLNLFINGLTDLGALWSNIFKL